MAGEVRRLVFSEGVVVNAPFSLAASSGSFVAYATDADYILNEGTPQEGSAYFNTNIKRLRIYNGTSFVNSHDTRSAIVDLSIGESSKAISFSSPWTDTNYVPTISILCNDADPIFLSYIIQNKTASGFTVKLNAPVDSNNYKISYHVEGGA